MTGSNAVGADDVAVIVVNWNSWQLTLDCLVSLRASEGAAWHLFLVDNGSTDDSREHLRALGSDVTVIFAPDNGGWTGGNNLGVEAAVAAGYRHMFILNSDATVQPDTLAMLVAAVRGKSPFPVLGPLHLEADGKTLDFIGATIDPATGMPTLMRAHEVDPRSLGAFYPTAYVRGAGLFVNACHVEAVGVFEDRFYLNYDDTDWCFRARAQGYDVQMMRDAAIIHLGSASIGGAMSPLNVYFITRNGLLFAERHCSARQRVRQAAGLVRWATTLSAAPTRWRRLAAMLIGNEPVAKAVRRGVRDYVLRRFGDCPVGIRVLSKSR